MPIELKNALAEWKKAKPLTLTKTGVSEALRLLPAEPKSVADIQKSIESLEKVKKVIDVAVANKHIAAEKKAHACLVEIQTAIKTQEGKLSAAAAKAAADNAAAAAKAAADNAAAAAKAAADNAAAAKAAAENAARAAKNKLLNEGLQQIMVGLPLLVKPDSHFDEARATALGQVLKRMIDNIAEPAVKQFLTTLASSVSSYRVYGITSVRMGHDEDFMISAGGHPRFEEAVGQIRQAIPHIEAHLRQKIIA